MIKNIIKKYFQTLTYFYSHLKYKIFIVFILNFLVGLLDGLGLTMFLPLLQLVNDSSEVDGDSLGKLDFIVDFMQESGIGLTLFSVLLFMWVFFLLKGLTQYVAGVYRVLVSQKFMASLRLNNVNGLKQLSYKFFVLADVGRIQNTLTGEVDRVSQAYTSYFKTIERGVMVVVYMGFAFTIDTRFALLVTIGGILTNFLYHSLYKKTKGESKKLTTESNFFQSLIIQNVTNFKYLKATDLIKNYSKKLSDSVVKIEKNNKKIGFFNNILLASKEPILVTVVVGVIFIQTSLLGSELGPILLSLIFFYRALIFVMQMQVDWNKFLSVSGSLTNMTQFENLLRKNKEITGKHQINEPVTELNLNNIDFYYGNTKVLSNIELTIKKEETVAFVGESGSGKTTLINILAGLFPVDRGNYRINNIDSRELDLHSFKKKIGYITQDAVIFNDTLFNNVTFWAESSNENLKRFWEAIHKASITEFVNSLENKEQEILGNNGVNLSGGQKQRISIARELYKHEVEILFLDEATSALDSETEKAIQQNIESLKGEYTILLIAHRISTIKNADRIVVMKSGKIISNNNYSNLMSESKYFRRLAQLQEL